MLAAEMFVFIVATVVIGAVVFGGTTLLYFVDKHAEDSKWKTLERIHERYPVPAPVEDPTQRHDKAA